MRLGKRLNALLKTIGEVAVLLAVLCIGILVGAGIRPAPAEWFGFAGALIGATVTVAGSVYVLDRERKREGVERKELLMHLLDEVDAACALFQLANQEALQERYGKTAKQQADELVAAVGRLRGLQATLKPNSVTMMKVSDAIGVLHVDPGIGDMATEAGMFPSSANFGGLNAIGHDVTGQISKVRALLTQG